MARDSPKNTNIIFSDVLIITDLNILIIHETDLNETDLRLKYSYTAKIYCTYTDQIGPSIRVMNYNFETVSSHF